MRELLVNWNFFVEVKGEADRLGETVRGMFDLEPLAAEFKLDENDFVHGLPKVEFVKSKFFIICSFRCFLVGCS